MKIIIIGVIAMLFGGFIFSIAYIEEDEQILFSKKGITKTIHKEQNNYYFTFVDDSITEYYTIDLYVSLLNVNGIYNVDLTQPHACDILYRQSTENRAAIEALTIDNQIFFSYQDTLETRESNDVIGQIIGVVFFAMGGFLIVSYLIGGKKKESNSQIDREKQNEVESHDNHEKKDDWEFIKEYLKTIKAMRWVFMISFLFMYLILGTTFYPETIEYSLPTLQRGDGVFIMPILLLYRYPLN